MWEPDFTLLSVPVRIPTPEVGSWFPEPPAAAPRVEPPPCKRHKPDPVRMPILPYAFRAAVLPKPRDPLI